MEKIYTELDYLKACSQANKEGKKVQLVRKELEYQVEVLEYEKKMIEVEIYDEGVNEDWNESTDSTPVVKTKLVEVDDLDKPIMVQEEVENLETGEKELVTVQKHHTETRTKVVETIELVEDEGRLQREFFNTSLGYVKRKVTMQDGTKKDFLTDILPLLEINIPILTYTQDGEQNKVFVTEEFINECKQQMLKDFYGGNVCV